MAKLIILLRVKDGMHFLPEWIDNVSKFADEVVAVDNGSTDGTLEMLKKSKIVTKIHETKGFDEGRDRILTYKMARERKANWLMMLDVDEVFEEGFSRKHVEKLMRSNIYTYYKFRRFHMIKDKNHYNAEKKNIEGLINPDRLLWRDNSKINFPNKKIHGALPTGLKGLWRVSTWRILHLANLHYDYRVNANLNYAEIDPGRATYYLSEVDMLNNQQHLKIKKFHNRRKHFTIIQLKDSILLIRLFFLLSRKAIGKVFDK